jgi:hypothetical protein
MKRQNPRWFANCQCRRRYAEFTVSRLRQTNARLDPELIRAATRLGPPLAGTLAGHFQGANNRCGCNKALLGRALMLTVDLQ